MKKNIKCILLIIISVLAVLGLIFIILLFTQKITVDEGYYKIIMIILQTLTAIVPITVTYIGQQFNNQQISRANNSVLSLFENIINKLDKNKILDLQENDEQIKNNILLYVCAIRTATTSMVAKYFNLSNEKAESYLEVLAREQKIIGDKYLKNEKSWIAK